MASREGNWAGSVVRVAPNARNMIDLAYGPGGIIDWRTGHVDICVIR